MGNQKERKSLCVWHIRTCRARGARGEESTIHTKREIYGEGEGEGDCRKHHIERVNLKVFQFKLFSYPKFLHKERERSMARWPLNPLKGRNTSRDHRQQLEELNLPMTTLNSLDEIIVEDPSEGQVQQVMRSDFQEEISAQDPSEGQIPQVMRSDCLEEISLEDEAKDVEDLAVGNEIENDSEELLHLISGVYLDLLRRLLESRSGTGVREDVGSIRSRHRLGRRCASSIGEQITHTIEIMIPKSMACLDDPRRKELEELEKEKILIDEKANVLVRRELWGGLGFLIVQTSAFMVLTFWKLSWVVMEPIWFCATSIYLIAGYVFFLRTSRDPSLESFYESRFKAKQKWLMKNKNFDIRRFNELRRACYSF